jgi:predicted metalloprotease with PDZ domain
MSFLVDGFPMKSTSLQTSGSFWLRLGFLALLGSRVLFGSPLPPELFAALSSQEFQVREAAEAKLLAWCKTNREPAMAELLKQSHLAGDPEVRVRCLAILRALVFEDYAREGEGYIGISMRDDASLVPGDDKLRSVIRVMATMPDTAASNAGIQPNDLIIGLANEVWHDVKASELFMKQIRSMKPGEKVKLKILRTDAIIDFTVTLGRRPVMADLQWFQGDSVDLQAAERAAKEAYFRRWLNDKKAQK